MIHPTAVVDKGARVAEDTCVWHFCHIMPEAEIASGCSLGQNVVMMPGSKLGRGCRVQNNVSLYTGVVCEDEVFLGPSCVFTNVINPRAFVVRKHEYRPTLVRRGASVGANVTIVCGCTVGAYAMIGAGAVVTKDVPDYALVYGCPARIQGWVSRLGHRLEFDAATMQAVCPESGERYLLLSDKRRVIAIDE